ncbi:MAG: hypothetical protein R3254_00390 [Thiomicrorhabdus sp.]|nr:hypothetical protein [Thiomicrorhabdus sp.]
MVKRIFVVMTLSLFMWQSVADAASISTRVRILESKVAKHEKTMKASQQSQQESAQKVDKGLAKIQALEKKISKLLKDEESGKDVERADKRYAFP